MLKLKNISKKLGNFSIKNIDLTVNKGDYLVLIGKSGAGKSMLLEIITGLSKPDSGRVLLCNNNLLDIPIRDRKIGIVFQKPSLFPHMTVYGNITYPLKVRNLSKNQIRTKVVQIADLLGISHLLDRSVLNLSGGEAQRVTIARTLVTDPELLLLDEPLAYLDVNHRREMFKLLKRINSYGQTIVHVTHDFESAISITNTIAVIENGEIIQSGAAQEVFNNPKSVFIADFIGVKNYYKGYISSSNGSPAEKEFISLSKVKINLGSIYIDDQEASIIIPDGAITVNEAKPQPETLNQFTGIVTDILQTKSGPDVLVDIGIELNKILTHKEFLHLNIEIGSQVTIKLDPTLIKIVRN